MEILHLPRCDKRFVVANKGKILIVTHNRQYAELIDKLIKENDYPANHAIVVKKQV